MSTSHITDEEHAKVDEAVASSVVSQLSAEGVESGALVLLTIVKQAHKLYFERGQPLNPAYLSLEPCEKLLEDNTEVHDILKSAHTTRKYADVLNHRECQVLCRCSCSPMLTVLHHLQLCSKHQRTYIIAQYPPVIG